MSITGHRDLTKGGVATVLQTLADVVRDPTVDAVYFGGALGADTYALRAALKLRHGHRPHLVVVVPNLVSTQPHSTWEWTQRADEVIEMHMPITVLDGYKAYTVRDQYLVDVASSLVAFYSGRRKSGTGKTIAMAEKRGIPVRIVPVKPV